MIPRQPALWRLPEIGTEWILAENYYSFTTVGSFQQEIDDSAVTCRSSRSWVWLRMPSGASPGLIPWPHCASYRWLRGRVANSKRKAVSLLLMVPASPCVQARPSASAEIEGFPGTSIGFTTKSMTARCSFRCCDRRHSGCRPGRPNIVVGSNIFVHRT
jgi:hypothetical protein